MPMISVIVPVYKVETYLCRCVDSILAQTFTDFELILVDDGSPDNCGAMCDEYAQKDSRVHVIHQKNGGLSAARNAGIDWVFAHSDSRWLTFIDSDDWVHPEILERLLGAAEDHHVSLCACGYVETSGKMQEVESEDFEPRIWRPEDFYIEQIGCANIAWGKLYRKESFQRVRYPVGKIHEDDFTTYRILFNMPEIAVIPARMYNYFQNPNGIMGSEWSPKRLDAFEASDEQLAFFQRNRYQAALRKRVQSELVITHAQLHEIGKLSEQKRKQYKKESRYLKKRMRKMILRYRDLGVIRFSTDKWLLEAAFPRLMQLYWLLTGIKNRK